MRILKYVSNFSNLSPHLCQVRLYDTHYHRTCFFFRGVLATIETLQVINRHRLLCLWDIVSNTDPMRFLQVTHEGTAFIGGVAAPVAPHGPAHPGQVQHHGVLTEDEHVRTLVIGLGRAAGGANLRVTGLQMINKCQTIVHFGGTPRNRAVLWPVHEIFVPLGCNCVLTRKLAQLADVPAI